MKTNLILILGLFFFLNLKSQTYVAEKKTTYFGLHIDQQHMIDSLKIPYLAISERNGVNDYGKIEVDDKKISKFKKFFSHDEFVFTPDVNTSSTELNTFFKDYKFSTDGDELYFRLIQYFGYDVIGFSKTALKNPKSKHRTIQIIEYRCLLNNTYGTIVLLGDENNLMEWVY